MANKYVDVTLDSTAYTLSGDHLTGVTTITVVEPIATSVPQTGSIRVGADALAYTSWTGSTFTLAAATTVDYLDLTVVYSSLNDGTSKENAWFSLIEVLAYTIAYGSIVAGDTVNVRTHDGANNCTENLTANIATAVPTAVGNHTKISFDDGTIWSTGGVFVLQNNSDVYIRISNYMTFLCDGVNHRFCIEGLKTNYRHTVAYLKHCFLDGIHFKCVAGASLSVSLDNNGSTSNVVIKDMLYEGKITSTSYRAIGAPPYGSLTLINPVIDLTPDTNQISNVYLFSHGTYGSGLYVLGGKIINSRNDLYLLAYSGGASSTKNVVFNGFDTGLLLNDYSSTLASASNDTYNIASRVSILGAQDTYDAIYLIGGMQIEWKKSNLQPTLSATLPDGLNTPWSYKVNAEAVTKNNPATLPPIEKVYQQATGIKTLTIEMLLNDNLDTTTMAGDLYAVFTYVDDNTGNTVTESTYSLYGAIPTSAAAWTAFTYGSNPYTAYKLELTTNNPVRANTKLYCTVYVGIDKVNSTDFFFVDPDIGIT